jgi:hypothetical protein
LANVTIGLIILQYNFNFDFLVTNLLLKKNWLNMLYFQEIWWVRGNKIPRVDQKQHHCLVEKGNLQRLGEETPTENKPAQKLRWQPHH